MVEPHRGRVGPVPRTAPAQHSRQAPSEAPPIVHDVLRSPGQPLDAGARSTMESRFGHDFSGIRVHTDGRAARSAAAVGARAYTSGPDLVFGEGAYAPHSPRGIGLIAHELVHSLQQSGSPPRTGALSLGRVGDAHEAEADRWSHGAHEPARASGGGRVRQEQDSSRVVRRSVGDWLSSHDPRPFLRDAKASIDESPQHVMEFFESEVWEAIKAHWVRISLITGAFIAAEAVIAAAEAAPTGITQVVGAILQVITLAVLGYFAAVEVKDAVVEAVHWWSLCRAAHGDRARITEASRSFVRLVWHIVMAVLAVAGVRAKIRGAGAAIRGAGAGAGTAAGGAGAAGAEAGAAGAGATGGEVVDIASHPGFRPRAQAPSGGGTGGTGGPVASGFDGNAAVSVAPAEPVPVPEPPVPAPAPAPAPGPAAVRTPSPGAAPSPVAEGARAGALAASPAADNGEKKDPSVVYRSMIEQGGAPKAEPTARGLGVRVGGSNPDVTVVAGLAQPGGGMSVAPDTPLNLLPHRRPPEWGKDGTGKDPVWAISPAVFAGVLQYVRDKKTHGYVGPRAPMPVDELQAALALSRPLWVKATPPERKEGP